MKKPKSFFNICIISAYGTENSTNYGCFGNDVCQVNKSCSGANMNCSGTSKNCY